jgi:hypothetical protein
MMPVQAKTSGLTRMLKADSKRIAWFLDLQRISHFPRSFMAPVAFSRLGRRPVANDPGLATEGVPWPRGVAGTSLRPRYHVTGASPTVKRAISSIDHPAPATLQRLVTKAASKIFVSPLPRHAQQSHPPGVPHDQPFRRFTGTGAAVGNKSSPPSARNHPLRDPGYRPHGSKNTSPLAPTPAISPSRRHSEGEPSQVSRHSTSGVGAIHQGRNLPLTSVQSSSGQRAAAQSPLPSSELDGTTDSDQAQPNKSAVSTLHIDGSALGRWAIQYLERALGKPTTGMTGIDPRASIPRSRVSPF